MSREGQVAWAAVLAEAAILETYGIVNGDPDDTFSEFIRSVFRVDTRLGRAVFVTSWGTLAAWFGYHILTGRKGRK